MEFLVDTYALIEWFRNNNPRYREYFSMDSLYINPFILMEFYYVVYHEFSEEKAEFLREVLLKNFHMLKINQSDLLIGVKFRSKMHKKKIKMSYCDAVSYKMAEKNKLKLLSGDEHFRNLDYVEFVK